jgi:heme o synthase
MSVVETPISGGRAVADWGAGSVADYYALMKPRVMSLVIYTALAGLLLAPSTIDPIQAVIALLCIAVGAGASGALNMWWDADIDVRMKRTALRPIPSGRIAADEARNLGIFLSAGSVMILGVATNWLAAALLAMTILYYVVFYTMWLKRRTVQNIVIGGAAGAFPPMIGWAAATGAVSLDSIVLFLIIFLWTPPHFWALALVKTEEYKNVGVPMLPVIEGPAVTRLQILLYSIVLVPATLLPTWLGTAGLSYAAVAAIGGAVFLWRAWAVYANIEGQAAVKSAWRLFGYSIFYLFLLFGALMVEHVALWAGILPAGWA